MPDQPAEVTPMASINGAKVMLCVWWVVFFFINYLELYFFFQNFIAALVCHFKRHKQSGAFIFHIRDRNEEISGTNTVQFIKIS